MKQETKIIPRFGPLFPCESWWFSREKKGNPGGHRDLENCVSNSWALQVVQIVMLGDLGSVPGLGKIPWRRSWQPTPVFFPGESPWTEEPGGLQSIALQSSNKGGMVGVWAPISANVVDENVRECLERRGDI